MPRREANPSISQTAILVGVAIVGTLVAVKAATRRKWQKTQSRKYVSCLPYAYNEAVVRSAIEQQLETTSDPSLIAADVAAQLFGDYPGGSVVSFPPGPDDPRPVQCVWALVVDLVSVIFKERKLPLSVDIDEEAQTSVWVIRDRNDPGYPWLQPSLEIENNPTPGMFLDLSNEQGAWTAEMGYDALIREVLATALIMAGKNPALASGSSSTSKRLRKELRLMFHCSQWLDQLYGQENPDNMHGPGEEPQDWMISDKGRGLNWRAVHADVGQQIANGEAPQRLTDLDGAGAGSSPMWMWVPAIDLDELRKYIPRVRALTWPDGTSTTEPPPVVQQLGIATDVVLPGGPGC